VIDRQGVIRYVFADWDYKQRADPDEVIGVIEEL
jgi:peroxiredoxin